MSNNTPSPFGKLDEVFAFRQTLTPETDRGCALMAAAYLDSQLEKLLRMFFIDDEKLVDELLGKSKPLGTFSSRIDVVFALGLIAARVHRDLHLIRKVRNDFGHKPEPMAFTDPAITSRCRELYHDVSDETASPRKRFVRTVMGVLAAIHVALNETNHTSSCADVTITEERRRAFRTREKEMAETIKKIFDEKTDALLKRRRKRPLRRRRKHGNSDL